MSATPTEAGHPPPGSTDVPPSVHGNGSEQPAPAPPAPTPAGGDRPSNPSFRGPLRYEVETSSSQLEAGKSFSIFIKITNPYDLPVKIISAKTEVPVEFMDAEKHAVSLWQAIKDSTAREVRQAGQLAKRQQVVSAVSVSVKDEIPVEGEEERPVLLQPGNSGLYEFKLCTRQVIFFTPSLYNMHMQVQYEMDGAVNHDTVKHQTNIRAPLKALIVGSVVGAWVGTILGSLLNNPGAPIVWLPTSIFMAKLVASVLLGAVIVVAFARKKDAQPFLSVEDFYGGFFIGFLAAWVGPSLLKGVLAGT